LASWGTHNHGIRANADTETLLLGTRKAVFEGWPLDSSTAFMSPVRDMPAGGIIQEAKRQETGATKRSIAYPVDSSINSFSGLYLGVHPQAPQQTGEASQKQLKRTGEWSRQGVRSILKADSCLLSPFLLIEARGSALCQSDIKAVKGPRRLFSTTSFRARRRRFQCRGDSRVSVVLKLRQGKQ